MFTEAYRVAGIEAQMLKERIERYGNSIQLYTHMREVLTYIISVLVQRDVIGKIRLYDPMGTLVLEMDAAQGSPEWSTLPILTGSPEARMRLLSCRQA